MYSPQSLILDSKSARAALVDLLRPDEIRELAQRLALDTTGDLWSQLRDRRVGKRDTNIWLGFFELSAEPDSDEQEHLVAHELEPRYRLFTHQRQAIRALTQSIKTYPHRTLLHMPTGSGKTRTAMNIICEHLRSHEPTLVFWLANSEELCSQAADEFESAWLHLGNRKVNVYRLWGGRHLPPENLSDGLVVAGLQTVYSRQVREQTWTAFAGERTSMVVLDEAHQAVAPTYRFVLDALTTRNPRMSVLGLTATPGRTWDEPEKDAELSQYFNRQKVTLHVDGYESPIDFLIDQGYLAEPDFRTIKYDSDILSAKDLEKLAKSIDIPTTLLRLLADDERRSVTIVRHAEDLARRHKRIILFATTKEHAERLAPILNSRGIAARSITSSTPVSQRQSSIRWYQRDSDEVRILTNYGVLTTGFDAPKTSAAIIARPTKSLVLYSQMIGRALRGPRAGGNDKAEILTVVDTSLPGFGSMSEAFENWEDVW